MDLIMNIKKLLLVVLFSIIFSVSANFAKAESQGDLSFDFDSITVRAALQLLAEYNNLNLVADDTVSGQLTMRMKGVTWQEAIDYVANVKGLLYTVEGKFLMVSKLPSNGSDASDFSFQQPQSYASAPAPPVFEKTTIIKISHVIGSEVIKPFSLLPNESLTADDGSSLILARMSPDRISDLREYLSIVDKPRSQVMIEARIVEVDKSYAKQLGVNWSGTLKPGNFTAASAGALVDASSLPVTAGIGFVSSAAILDIDLAAMEKSGNGRIISKPRVFASHKQQARIVKGSEVPYQQSAGDGATSVAFKEAALSLDVTPFIDNTGVMLDIKLSKDEPDFSNAINGVPPINTASLSSNVRVRLGSTVALGGVYSTFETTQEHRVPGLGSIPWFGRMFRYDTHSTSTAELILFITPTLVPN